jgi:hypothetical protein
VLLWLQQQEKKYGVAATGANVASDLYVLLQHANVASEMYVLLQHVNVASEMYVLQQRIQSACMCCCNTYMGRGERDVCVAATNTIGLYVLLPHIHVAYQALLGLLACMCCSNTYIGGDVSTFTVEYILVLITRVVVL